jgi:hypothetical protein
VLVRLQSIQPAAFAATLARLRPLVPPALPSQAPVAEQHLAPTAFLLAVMNDHAMDMQWRIEAAKALLPYFVERQ